MTTTINKSGINIITVPPVYGDNYDKGYIGFTYDPKSLIGRGIAYFTKWDKMSNIFATHALIVTGKNTCIEADALSNCVKENKLDDHFNHETRQIFFRKPKNLTDEIAQQIVNTAQEKVGEKYDHNLILAHAFSGTLAGRISHHLIKGALERKLSEYFNSSEEWICSELVAYVLDVQPEYKDKGILEDPHATINPQELFEDSVIFEPWK